MYAIFLLSVVALASAAPRYGSWRTRESYDLARPFTDFHHHNDQEVFDADRFWKELSDEISKLDEAINGFHQHFPSGYTQEKVEGDQYKIIISLSGYSVNEVVVKAREGLLMVQATHKFENNNMNSYMNIRSLPSNVNPEGTWTFEDDTLTIAFPLKSKTETTTELPTLAPKEESREEMDNTSDDFKSDVDVGLARGDKDAEILTNEIPNNKSIEATTYAVDISNEIEFVPVPYKK